MRLKLIFLFVSLSFFSCKNEQKPIEPKKELTPAERIAEAHGFSKWDQVTKIEFTFSVIRGDSEFSRSWVWEPKSDNIIAMSETDTLRYNRSSLDSISMSADRGFINDKYWMFVPFQMMWDDGLSLSEPIRESSPVNQKELNKITLTYGDNGGYTPGDAYDIYYNDDYMIEEWIFRKSNMPEPSLVCTFESYQDFGGLLIATEHKKPNEDWNLKFKNIKVSWTN